MKPDPNTMALSRIRHEIDVATLNEQTIDQLSNLIEFLGRVKPDARLRAKTEGGVSFLHTRTGTFFGQWIKRLTVAWPAAQQQRQLAKNLVQGVLDKLNGDNPDIQQLKGDILNKTLQLKADKEFDIVQLSNQLKLLRVLLKPGSAASATIDSFPASLPHVHTAVDTGLAEADLPASRQGDVLVSTEPVMILSESAQTAQNDITSPALIHAAPLSYSEKPHNLGPVNSIALTDTAKATVTGAGKHIQCLGSEPSEPSTFGCYQLVSGLSASARHGIGAYHADAYILSGEGKDLKFRSGSAQFNLRADLSNDNRIRFSEGTHTFHDEARTIKKLQLQAADGDLFTLLSEEEQARHLKDLRQLYINALTLAHDKGAQQIALQPVRKGQQILVEKEIQALANAIREFQQTHPDVKIHVVLIRSQELQHFNAAIGVQ